MRKTKLVVREIIKTGGTYGGYPLETDIVIEVNNRLLYGETHYFSSTPVKGEKELKSYEGKSAMATVWIDDKQEIKKEKETCRPEIGLVKGRGYYHVIGRIKEIYAKNKVTRGTPVLVQCGTDLLISLGPQILGNFKVGDMISTEGTLSIRDFEWID